MAQYKTGTVTVTNGDATVVGVGTAWLTEAQDGDLFSLQGQGNAVYVVLSRTDDTHLELTTTYGGATASGALYAITRDFTPTYNLPLVTENTVDGNRIISRATTMIDTLFGSSAQLGEDEVVTGTWVFPNKTRFGTTPNDTWSITALEISTTGALSNSGAATFLTENAYYNSGWKYQNTLGASLIQQDSGTISLKVAASGTADSAITWTTGLKVDSTGNLHVGSTAPNDAWNTGYAVVEVGSTGTLSNTSTIFNVSQNAYASATGWKYQNTATASLVQLGSGLGVYTAVSGTADTAITWKSNITTDSTGVVKGLGGNWLISPGNLDFAPAHHLVVAQNDSASAYIQIVNGTTSTTSTDGFLVGIGNAEQAILNNQENTDMWFQTNGVYRGKIAAGGSWLISPSGTDITPVYQLHVYGTAGNAYGIFNNAATGSSNGLRIGVNPTGDAEVWQRSNLPLKFGTNDATRGAITSAGKWIISPTGYVSTTPGYDLLIHGGAGQAFMQFAHTTSGDGGADGFQLGLNADLSAAIIQRENADIRIYTSNTQRGYIAAAGNLQWAYPVVAGSYLQATGGGGATIDTMLYLTNTGNGAAGRGTRIEMTVPGLSSAEEGVQLSAYSTGGATTTQSADLAISLASVGTYYERVRFYSTGGTVFGSPTGGDKGAGTVNAVAVYDDNVLLTDYVFDYVLDGEVKEQDLPQATQFLKDTNVTNVDHFAVQWKTNHHLPSMPSREEFEADGMSIGKLAQRLWETVELQAIHIESLNERIKKLEGK